MATGAGSQTVVDQKVLQNQSAAAPSIHWYDALGGLAQFIAATKRDRQAPVAQNSFSGIGGGQKGGPLSSSLQIPPSLGKFI